MPKKVYIAGAGGMLGSDVYKLFSSTCEVRASDIDVNEDWLVYGDVRHKEAIYKDIKTFNPDLIINLAALTDLEECEEKEETAHSTNYMGARNLGDIAQGLDVPYIYISTAGIFDGTKELYTEDDIPHPTSVYAVTKYKGECYVLDNIPKAYVFRAGWMMGGGKKDKKFIGKILKQIKEGATELFAVADKQGTPTYTLDFAECMYSVLKTNTPYGLYNMVCGGRVSRLDVAKAIVDELGLNIPVIEVSSNYFSEDYFAPRPACEAMENTKLNALGKNTMRDWKICLKDYLDEK